LDTPQLQRNTLICILLFSKSSAELRAEFLPVIRICTLGTFEGQWREYLRGQKAFDLPKLFLRLRTELQPSDFPMTLAKWFFIKSAIDSIELAFYHHH
jgi:hypothetical protein